MSDILDIIDDYSPPNESVGVPLSSTITILFDRLMDEEDLAEKLFVSGPDTDQFIGPGVAEFNIYPNNVSQGDDFLESPGYPGIVQGSFSFEDVDGTKTRVTFTPSQPMAALTDYTAHLPSTLDADGNSYTDSVTFSWTTGSGSIEELPSSVSTSVLFTSTPAALSALSPLQVVRTTPAADSVEQNANLSRIVVEFDKEIEESSIDADAVIVRGYPLIDHPLLSVSYKDILARKITVSGKKILIDL